jgi:undecaprenyl-diphosphatase
VFVGLSLVGYYGLVWIALAVPIARLAQRNVRFAVLLTAACVWSADLIALAIKLAVGRPRPFETIPEVDKLLGGTVGQSMPSGHAATSFAGAVVLTYLLPKAAPILFLLAIAISFSRIYVGVHYPSDVLVGAALAAAVGLTGVALVRGLRPTSGGPRQSVGVPPAG